MSGERFCRVGRRAGASPGGEADDRVPEHQRVNGTPAKYALVLHGAVECGDETVKGNEAAGIENGQKAGLLVAVDWTIVRQQSGV